MDVTSMMCAWGSSAGGVAHLNEVDTSRQPAGKPLVHAGSHCDVSPEPSVQFCSTLVMTLNALLR